MPVCASTRTTLEFGLFGSISTPLPPSYAIFQVTTGSKSNEGFHSRALPSPHNSSIFVDSKFMHATNVSPLDGGKKYVIQVILGADVAIVP